MRIYRMKMDTNGRSGTGHANVIVFVSAIDRADLYRKIGAVSGVVLPGVKELQTELNTVAVRIVPRVPRYARPGMANRNPVMHASSWGGK